MPLASIGQASHVAMQNGTVAKVKELVDVLNNGEGFTTSVDITDIVGMRLHGLPLTLPALWKMLRA